MKKYNLSNIMKRAWELVKGFNFSISLALKKAWSEAKSLKEQLISKLNLLVKMQEGIGNGYHYEIVVKDWNNYGKSRTYFSIIETRDNRRHYKKFDYGYFDNQYEKYFPEKYNDLTKNYTLGGYAF